MKINLDDEKDILKLREAKINTEAFLYGKILTARDAAHKKIEVLINDGKELPISLTNSLIYYMGPTPAKPGAAIGSCGPTSSYRMDDYLETTLKLGVVATIGKGERAETVKALIKKYRAPYLVTIGGAGAYLARCVKSAKVILFPELGAEAIFELTVENFPVITGIDIYGNTIFKE